MSINPTDISIKLEVMAGADIPKSVIPQMVALANKIGCGIEASLNEVTTIAYPGDDALDLAVAWRRALRKPGNHKFAFAKEGKQLMEGP